MDRHSLLIEYMREHLRLLHIHSEFDLFPISLPPISSHSPPYPLPPSPPNPHLLSPLPITILQAELILLLHVDSTHLYSLFIHFNALLLFDFCFGTIWNWPILEFPTFPSNTLLSSLLTMPAENETRRVYARGVSPNMFPWRDRYVLSGVRSRGGFLLRPPSG